VSPGRRDAADAERTADRQDAPVPPGPIVFAPLYVPRVWGGRRLSHLLGRDLPGADPIGEAWELVDRPDAQSVVADGPLRGRTLHELWTTARTEVFGTRGAAAKDERFPLLVKLLDARAALSVQVHPPPACALTLGGEPKSEAWWLLDAEPGSFLYAGLRSGVTRERFVAAYGDGDDLTALLHRVPVRRGDVMAVPNGRVHAIGPGCLVLEVQQNSDTTYRVFDYGRPGLDGRPRDLHVDESLHCIAWDDHEPGLAAGSVVANEHFAAERVAVAPGATVPAAAPGECAVVSVLGGAVVCGGRRFARGATFLAPAAELSLAADPGTDGAEVLRTTLPG
jgi:mannose-6-phosphate isomerase